MFRGIIPLKPLPCTFTIFAFYVQGIVLSVFLYPSLFFAYLPMFGTLIYPPAPSFPLPTGERMKVRGIPLLHPPLADDR